ncbi:uncharacterized protein KY384_001239 [Bacidia gigantensis]|uniref:uncharacterized protein n=1 Tax=Bacidia gigantensis TaxID=2732470 RepID=UPI001D03ABC2|nr:uncharacterized protein KY384_001239 [Bacidia gigantensis]KAG8534394.1 hypothetical protein KY384_001239 [Bacidia gigantensis]
MIVTSSPRYLFLPLLLFIPLILLFRSDVSQRFSIPRKQETEQQGGDLKADHLYNSNASNFQHQGVFDENHEGAPQIVQVSMQFGGNFDLMYEKGLRTHLAHGDKWGYPTHFLRNDIVGHGDFGVGIYDKVLYLLAIMVNEMTKDFGKRAEWIVWTDADTIHLNNLIPWTIFLPPNEGMFHDINMLVSRDWIGFNAGVFLIRVCEWSITLISDAIALPRLRPEVDLPFKEQDALRYMFDQPENKKHRIYQPRHWFNVYDEYYEGYGEKVMRGSVSVHFPGMGGARPDAMGRWLDKIEHRPEEINIPLQNTTYPEEIEAYWSRLRSAAEMLQRSDDFKNQVKDEHYDIYVQDGGKIPDKLGEAESELHEVIEEDAFDKQKLKEGVLKLDAAVRNAKKDVEDAVHNAEEAQKKKEAEQKKKEEEAQKKKEEEDRRKQAAKQATEQQNGATTGGSGASSQDGGTKDKSGANSKDKAAETKAGADQASQGAKASTDKASDKSTDGQAEGSKEKTEQAGKDQGQAQQEAKAQR